jgi:hypothetical protein
LQKVLAAPQATAMVASNGVRFDEFAFSIALPGDGNTLVAGVPNRGTRQEPSTSWCAEAVAAERTPFRQ